MDLGLRAAAPGDRWQQGIGRRIAETFAVEGADRRDLRQDAAEVRHDRGAVRARHPVIASRWTSPTAMARRLGDGLRRAARRGRHRGGNVSALAIPDHPRNWKLSYEVDLMHAVRMVDAGCRT